MRVTLSDGSERDCLQKIYKVGNLIAAGFAGSVAIGFGMIDKLTELLACDDPMRAWDLLWSPRGGRKMHEKYSTVFRQKNANFNPT